MSDDAIRRYAKRAKAFLDAAKEEVRRAKPKGEWEEPDFAEVTTIAGMAMNLAMNEERLGSVVCPQQIVEAGSVRHLVCGWHLPGHLDERGAAVVVMLPSGVRRTIPNDALPVAIIVPPGREKDMLKSYPEAK